MSETERQAALRAGRVETGADLVPGCQVARLGEGLCRCGCGRILAHDFDWQKEDAASQRLHAFQAHNPGRYPWVQKMNRWH